LQGRGMPHPTFLDDNAPFYHPHHHVAQGLVERVNRTMKEEWLMWREPRNIDELQETIDEFTEWYNTNREHSSLDYKVPSEVHYATT